MKKLESSLLNMVVVLTLVSVITGGLLAAVNSVTEGPIQEQKDKALADGIKAVMGADDIKVTADDKVNSSVDGKDREYIIHRVANANGEPIGVAVESASQGFSGDVKVLVASTRKAPSRATPFWSMQRLRASVPVLLIGSRPARKATSSDSSLLKVN